MAPEIDIRANAPYIIGIAVIAVLLAVAVFALIDGLGNQFSATPTDAAGFNAAEQDISGQAGGHAADAQAGDSTSESCLIGGGYSSVIYLYSPTCPHCVRMMPIVDELISDGKKIEKLQASSHFSIIASCVNVRPVVPQFICPWDGGVVEGELSREELDSFIRDCAAKAA